MSVVEIANRISEILGKPIDMQILNYAKAEIPEQYLDGSKIKEILGWEAKTNFNEAIIETSKWYESI